MDLNAYSENEQKIIQQILNCDNGFHSKAFVASAPFAEIETQSQGNLPSINEHCYATVATSSNEYDVELLFSSEEKCWFYRINASGADEYAGVVHFNVILNARGTASFVFLNDNTGGNLSDITFNLKFCDFMILEL